MIVSVALVSALTEFTAPFAKTYNLSKDSKLYKARCLTCHTAMKTKTNPLNPYGKDLKEFTKGSKKLTPELLAKIEGLDSDKDGVKNLQEIKDGTLPGDPKSVKSD
jgi:hypothetical protein